MSYANRHTNNGSHFMTRNSHQPVTPAPEPPPPQLVRAVTFAAVTAAVSLALMLAAGAVAAVVAAVRYISG